MTDDQTPSSTQRSPAPVPEGLRPSAAAPPADRLGAYAFAFSTVSAVTYFSTSEGIRNFVSFLVDGIGKSMRLLGLGP